MALISAVGRIALQTCPKSRRISSYQGDLALILIVGRKRGTSELSSIVQKFAGLSAMQKLAVVGALASILGLIFALAPNHGTTDERETGIGGNINSQGSQAIGNNYGSITINNNSGKQLLPAQAQASGRSAPTALDTSIYIPSDVERMWVFYQDSRNQNPAGCERPPNADPILPQDVATRIGEFRATARATGRQLILTAYSPSRGWDAAAAEIRVNGKRLQPMTRYWCNNQMNYGYLVRE